MINTIPVTFKNKDGYELFGIVNVPSRETQKKTGIIILSPGVKNRVAPHRMYVKMARRFCDMGFYVLRFDFYGLGDSEGEINDRYLADFYGSVQVGRYIDDTISSMDWMEKEYNVNRFILAGLCGGAITGLLTGAKDMRVDSLLGLGIPVILDSVNISADKYMTEGQLKDLRQSYLQKLIDFRAWLNFLTFKSDYRVLFKSLLVGLKKKAREPEKDSNTRSVSVKNGSNFNPYFPEALHQMLNSRKIFLIFSEADRLYWEFKEKYMNQYKKEFDTYKNNFEIDITENANHIFSYKEWQQNMLNESCLWLEKHYSLS